MKTNDGIEINHVAFSYFKNTPVLNDISYHIKTGIFLGIAGANGSGKTTFTYLLNGLIPHFVRGNFRGDVFINNINTKSKKVHDLSKKVGMLFQNPDFSLFNLTVKEELAFGLKNMKKEFTISALENALKMVGLENFLDRDPQTLSLGEKQKVCLASVLCLDTPYLVLDEPIAMLDFKSAVEIYEILNRLKKTGKTIIVVEHDTDFLQKYTDEMIILGKGKIISAGTTRDVLKNRNLLIDAGIKPTDF